MGRRLGFILSQYGCFKDVGKDLRGFNGIIFPFNPLIFNSLKSEDLEGRDSRFIKTFQVSKFIFSILSKLLTIPTIYTIIFFSFFHS